MARRAGSHDLVPGSLISEGKETNIVNNLTQIQIALKFPDVLHHKADRK